MEKPIIYLNRNFREEFIQQTKDIAPEYEIKRTLTPEDLPAVEISLGWDKKLADFFLSDQSNLKWIQSISAGVDYMPLNKFKQKDILLSNASGIHAVSISEHVIGVLLAYYRGIIPSVLAQSKKHWLKKEISYDQISGKRMLIIGTGHIGQQLAASVKSLGVQVFGINSSGHPAENFIETYSFKNRLKIAEEMDIVINILPLTEETTGIYNTDFFEAMKATGVFMNVGRGGSVSIADLETALRNHTIQFASLDVFDQEPLPSDSPLWELENLLITPHISGMTVNFQQKLMDIFLANLKTYHENQELSINQIDFSKGY